MIRVIHKKVPGRVRFKVNGLYNSEPLKKVLEERLSGYKKIQHVSASTITANILVIFNASLDYLFITELITTVLSEIIPQKSNSPNHDTPDPMPKKDFFPIIKEKTVVLKQTIDKLLHHYEKQDPLPWHTLSVEAIFSHFQTDSQSPRLVQINRSL